MDLRSFTNKVRAWRDHVRRGVAIFLFDKVLRNQGPFQEAILFVRWDAKLGDTVVLSWVWRAIRAYRPDLKLWIITGPEFSDWYASTYGFDKVLLAPRRPRQHSFFKMTADIKKPRYVVHLSQALKARDLFFLRLVQPAHVASLDDALQCIDIKLGKLTEGRHFSEKLVPFLEQLSIPVADRRYWLPQNNNDRAKIMTHWPTEKVIGFCPNGASKHRCFSDAKIVWTVQTLLASSARRHQSIRVLLIVTLDHVARLSALMKAHGLSDAVLFRPTGHLTELIEQVRLCAGVISVDTSLVHVASGLEKPLLAFYHPPNAANPLTLNNFGSWHPNSDHAQALVADKVWPQRIDAFEDDRLSAAIDQFLSRVFQYSAEDAVLVAT